MKSGISYLILLFFMRYAKAADPLALSVSDGYYKLVAYEDVEHRLNRMERRDSSNSFVKSIFCCPAQTEEGVSFSHVVEKIIADESAFEEDFACESECQPSVQDSKRSAEDFVLTRVDRMATYAIGYNVCDPNGELKNARLPGLKSNTKCDFFSTMEILFDTDSESVQQVRYEVVGEADGEPNQYEHDCENFDLGKDLISFNMETVYGRDNQNEVLKDMGKVDLVIVGNTTVENLSLGDDISILRVKCSFSGTPVKEMWKDEPEPLRDYFMRRPLAPAAHFRGKSLQSTTCSDLITAPVWPNTDDALDRVEIFIQTLANVKQVGNLNIITGPSGVYKYSAIEDNACTAKTLKYLYESDGNKKVLVPEIFYTIVVHSLYEGNDEHTRNDFGMILITPNGKWINSMDTYCEEIDCSLSGFGKVNDSDQDDSDQGDSDQKVKTRCCAFNTSSLRKLKINYSDASRSQRHKLNLNAFYLTMDAFRQQRGSINVADMINL